MASHTQHIAKDWAAARIEHAHSKPLAQKSYSGLGSQTTIEHLIFYAAVWRHRLYYIYRVASITVDIPEVVRSLHGSHRLIKVKDIVDK